MPIFACNGVPTNAMPPKAHKAKPPKRSGVSRSTIITFLPARSVSKAVTIPAIPPPQTKTSQEWVWLIINIFCYCYYLQINVNNRSEEHTSELQSRPHLVCRLLLEK